MKEVSCRVLSVIAHEAKRRRFPLETLTAGTQYTIEFFHNKQERISWDEFVIIMKNVRRLWTEEEIVELGARIVLSPIFRLFLIAAKLLFSTRDFYFWIHRPNTGGGNLAFTCIKPHCRDTGVNRLEIKLLMQDGYPSCREFFLLSKGGTSAFSVLLGFNRAVVHMEEIPGGMRYDVEYPPGGGTFAWIRKLLTQLFSSRTIAHELLQANEVLATRYQELDQARGILALQTTQLQTANSINQLIHADLDLDKTLITVANSLVDVGGFDACSVKLDVKGESIHLEIERGIPPKQIDPLNLSLESHGRSFGTMQLWPTVGANLSERRELLAFILPTIAMALDNAITYRSLADYRSNLEHKVEQRTAELRQARDSLAETVDRLERAKAVRDRIFSNVNHEIRTPLSLILASVHLLRESQPEDSESLSAIELSTRKLVRLVDELLLLAAGSEGKLPLHIVRTDIAKLCKQLASAWRPMANRDGLSLAYVGPEACSMDADEVVLERVISNLLSNALKFTPEGGHVELSLAQSTDSVTIAVRDTGRGIDDELHQRLFGRFEQGAPSPHRNIRGSGIGLSLVKELVEAHKGSVAVERPSTGGAVFVITLPNQQQTVFDHGSRPYELALRPNDFGHDEAPPKEVPPPRLPGAAATVLVAEDDPHLRASISRLLAEEYRVLVADDGQSALELAKKELPDLLVSDVEMPGMNGIELTRQFRQLSGGRLAPVLLLTAYVDIDNRLSGFEAGAVDYIAKPFAPAELMARVRSQLRLRSLALKLHESEKLVALGTLSAGLAHEIRNPANAIVNATGPLLELLPVEMNHPESPAKVLLDVLRDCSNQLVFLSRQLLGFKRTGEIEHMEVALHDFVTQVVTITHPSWETVKLKLDIDGAGTIRCAIPLLTQALANVLQNAAQAAGPGGWVRLHARLDGSMLVFDVSDSGPGVPPELRERIFEPFFTTKPPGAGTGLGLTNTRQIIQDHRGAIEVRQQDEGSVFRIELPILVTPSVNTTPPPKTNGTPLLS